MLSHRLNLFFLFVLLLTACAPPATPAVTVTPASAPTGTPTLAPSSTRTPTATATPAPTATASATPSPTGTPTASATPTATLTPTPSDWPTVGWRNSTPEQQGMDSGVLAAMFDHIAQEQADLHSLLVVRNGYMVTEAYFFPYRRDTRHDLYSCSKSFTSALVGIAIDAGYIDGLDQKVLDFFPTRTFANPDARKEAITLEHLLTMRSGLAWPEYALPYNSSRNVLMQMLRSRDWVQFVLDRPMAVAPGTTFNYNTGGAHLLSAVIGQATGMSAFSFARTHLFKPLGISNVAWDSDPQGITFGGGGIWMTSRDMAKFGYLYLQGGVWEGRQVVPAAWVEASVAAPYYGYQWWILGNGAYVALGYRGQRILVLPALEMVVVFTGGLADESLLEVLVDEFIVPAARSPDPLPENPQGVALLEARIEAAGRPAR